MNKEEEEEFAPQTWAPRTFFILHVVRGVKKTSTIVLMSTGIRHINIEIDINIGTELIALEIGIEISHIALQLT